MHSPIKESGIKESGRLGRSIRVSLDEKQLEQRCARRLEELRRNTRLPGFRKGKAPVRLIRVRYEADLRREETDRLMREGLDRALSEHAPDIIGPVRLGEPVTGDSGRLSFTAEFEIYPECDLGSLAELEVEKPVAAPVTPAELERMLEELRRRHRRLEPVERPSGPGDVVEIDLFTPPGVAGPAPAVPGREENKPGQQQLLVELVKEAPGGAPGDWLRHGLLGTRAGELLNLHPPPEAVPRRSVILTSPEPWRVKVRRVLAPRLPEPSELLQILGFQEDRQEQFHTRLARNMEEQAAAAARDWQWEALLQSLTRKFDFELPGAALEEALEAEKKLLLEARAARTGPPPGVPGADSDGDTGEQAVKLEARALLNARHRLRHRILVHKLMLHFKLDASREEVREAMQRAAAHYEHPENAFQALARNEAQQSRFTEQVLADKLLAAVHRVARTRERPLDFFTLRAGPAAQRGVLAASSVTGPIAGA